MSWIGLSDNSDTAFDRDGIGPLRPAPTRPERYASATGEDILVRGTLLLEASAQPGRARKTDLVNLVDQDNQLAIWLTRDGALAIRFGPGTETVATQFGGSGFADGSDFRLTLSWDAAFGTALASVEDLASGTLRQAELEMAAPVRSGLMRELLEEPLPVGLRFLAVADTIEPVGLVPGFARDTAIDTPGGQRMVQHLRAGDLVITADRGPQPIRWIGRRDIPAAGELMPIRLRAPYFGLVRDIMVSADLRVLASGTEVEYLFGQESVLIEARHLVNGISASRANREKVVDMYHIVLDAHEILSVSGSSCESLFLGRLAQSTDILATTMLYDANPERLPIHEVLARPALKPFEAATLASRLT